ncbi:MAG: hypothetical protein KKE44_16815 [Proteobacteria bacterium]|nr:hypothetical protein [Pseudomonadota bacterium]MBU1584394.1 hypothetical protein [Pseudomonadota bacterium]MBU2452713.1 hypothetical protein [Pseudomonadota bacterium]MBU2631865.1 hypothetical protein [Pseudomonadota bacterium]
MNKKKLAAAMAAVFAYMKTSEEAAAYSAQQESQNSIAAPSQMVMQPQNIWGISGRQTHMQANSMMQLRMFK